METSSKFFRFRSICNFSLIALSAVLVLSMAPAKANFGHESGEIGTKPNCSHERQTDCTGRDGEYVDEHGDIWFYGTNFGNIFDFQHIDGDVTINIVINNYFITDCDCSGTDPEPGD